MSHSQGARAATLTATVVLAAFAAAAPAVHAKGKGSVATASETAPLASSQTQSATARCPGGMHLTGGGFSVAPAYNPAGSVGTKTMVQISQPVGKKLWSAAAGAVQVPISAGSFTSYARCEKNSLGKISVRANSATSIPPRQAQTSNFRCPSSSHVITGGYSTDHPFAAPDLASSQLTIVQSQRTSKREWAVTGYNASASLATTMTAYAYCELNRGAEKIATRSATVPLADDARVTAQGSCSKKQHVVSGGFSINPLPSQSSVIPSAGVDESLPAGKGWRVGVYENPGFILPAGSTLTVQAYCKKS